MLKPEKIITFITATLVIFSFGIQAQESEDSVEELRRVRDELKTQNEQLQKEVLEKSSEENENNENKQELDINQEEDFNTRDTTESKSLNNNDNDNVVGLETQKALREEIEDLKENIDDLRDDIEDDLEDIEEDLTETNEDIREDLEDLKEDKEENRNGGGAVISFQLIKLDMDPIKSLCVNDPELKLRTFDFSRDNALIFSVMGYYNIENGISVGNIFSGGYKTFRSDVYGKQVIDSATTDTTYDSLSTALNIIPVSIGFVCEKAFTFYRVHVFMGLMLGGSAKIIIKEIEHNNSSAFIGTENENFDDENEDQYSVAFSPAVAWDFHGGVAFQIAPMLNIGVDGVLGFEYAYNGYGAAFGDYFSFTPGIRFRLNVGRVGQKK